MNTLQGVQAIVDNYTAIVLDQTLQLLLIMQKVGGPANAAIGSWVNFALNANNALIKFKNQYDKISASMEQKEFTKTPLKTKESLMGDLEKKANEATAAIPTATEVKPSEAKADATLATDVKPVKGKASGPAKAKVGGKRKKRKKKTKKKNQKKRTKRKSRRRK